jgi:hypothetical protein
MRMIAVFFGPCTPDVLSSRISVFSYYFKTLDHASPGKFEAEIFASTPQEWLFNLLEWLVVWLLNLESVVLPRTLLILRDQFAKLTSSNPAAVGLIGGAIGSAIGYCAYYLVRIRVLTVAAWIKFEVILALCVIIMWGGPIGETPIKPEAWELLFYVCAAIFGVNTALLPLFIVAVLCRTRPESAKVYLPIGGILAGLLVGGVLVWALARHVNGVGDVFTIIGTCTGVFGGMGVGIEYLIPREKTEAYTIVKHQDKKEQELR